MLEIKEKLSKFKSIAICQRCSSKYECNHYEAKKSRVGDLCKACKDFVTNLESFTQKDLQDAFIYDENTGDLIHRLETRKSPKGSLATYSHFQGYLSVSIGRKEYLAHRIIWFIKTGHWPAQVDHINHDRTDNRWSNLREVVSRQNQLNTSLSSNNSSGVNGVRILPSKRYCAFIMVQGKQISLGTYDTLEEAASARKLADQKYGFHVNHGS